jgi:SpoVK/Ycf46/Vps4 family AAA+-type ATPase
MTARSLGTRLDLPLITVELATVMSSYLGKTGQNLRRLLDHSRDVSCVLFLDEFDAVAKSRDDQTEIGELKRLVNMLLLELDRWPASGLLVAATNHPKLLDPAVERRFDLIIDLAPPAFEQRLQILTRALDRLSISEQPSAAAVAASALAFDGESGAGLERLVAQAARAAIVEGIPLPKTFGWLVAERLLSEHTTREQRSAFAGIASEQLGMTQREIAPILGVTHPTVGKLAADWRKSLASNGASKRPVKVKTAKSATKPKRKKVGKS